MAIRSLPGNVTLVGWDEWILATVVARLGLVALPQGELYDILVPTGYSYPPLYFWLSGPLVTLFGPEWWVLRLPTSLSDAACVAMVFVLGRRVGGPLVGWTSGLLSLSALFIAFHPGHTLTIDFTLSIWILLSLDLFVRGYDEDRRGLILWSVFVGSLACFTKYHGVIYYAMLCAAIVIMPRSRAMVWRWRFLPFAAVAMFLPCTLLAIEGITWKFYGWEKTHIAEVFRVMTWDSWVRDPFSGEVERTTWYFYFAFCWARLGTVVCMLSVAGAVTVLAQRRRYALLLLAMIALWFLWASTANLHNPRYVLPMVYLCFVFVGFLLKTMWDRPKLRLVAVLLLALAVGDSLGRTAQRVRDYRRVAGEHDAVHAYVNVETPEDARFLADSRLFQTWDQVGLSPIQRKVLGPDWVTWESEADYVIMHGVAERMMAAGMLPVHQTYRDQWEEVRATWTEVFRVGEGDDRVRVLQRPDYK